MGGRHEPPSSIPSFGEELILAPQTSRGRLLRFPLNRERDLAAASSTLEPGRGEHPATVGRGSPQHALGDATTALEGERDTATAEAGDDKLSGRPRYGSHRRKEVSGPAEHPAPPILYAERCRGGKGNLKPAMNVTLKALVQRRLTLAICSIPRIMPPPTLQKVCRSRPPSPSRPTPNVSPPKVNGQPTSILPSADQLIAWS